MTDLRAAHDEMMRLSRLIDDRLAFVKVKVREYAQAERDYRKLKAQSWVTVSRERPDGTKVTAAELKDCVDAAGADARYARDVAQGMQRAAFIAVESAQDQLKAWQSMLKADKAELDLAKYGPEMTP